MNHKQIEKRLAELREQRAQISDELETARITAPQALIDGKEPKPTAPLSERLEALNAAIATLDERRQGAFDSAARATRTKQIDRALETTAERKNKAAAVDDSLKVLADTWSDYRESVRQSIGQVTSSGGDVVRLNGVALNNRASESLIKAMVKSSNLELVRALGIDTPVRPRHAISLADVEDQVALSLQSELARVKASSPQPNIAREAQKELAELEDFLK